MQKRNNKVYKCAQCRLAEARQCACLSSNCQKISVPLGKNLEKLNGNHNWPNIIAWHISGGLSTTADFRLDIDRKLIWVPSVFPFVRPYVRDLSVRMNISNTNEYFFRYFTHAFITILPWILWSVVRIKFKMADLLPFLFAQIDKIFENVVRLDEYLQHQWTFLPDSLHMH